MKKIASQKKDCTCHKNEFEVESVLDTGTNAF